MFSFNYFVHKSKLKNKATSNIKISQVLPSIRLDNVDIYVGDSLFSSVIGMVHLQPSKRTQCVVYINEVFLTVVVPDLRINYLNS